MRRGVAGIAAADGEVLVARDGQPDRLMQDAGPATTVDERNGNWVALRHDDGWATTYAHMRNGSLAVRVGQRAARGDKARKRVVSGKGVSVSGDLGGRRIIKKKKHVTYITTTHCLTIPNTNRI